MKVKTLRKILILIFVLASACSLLACKNKKNQSEGYSEAPHLTHECTKIRAKEATCYSQGNIEYWACYGCDKIFADNTMQEELTASDVILDKVPHTPVFVEATEPTCVDEGNEEYWCCTECFTYFEEQSCQNIISNKANVLVKTLPHNLAKIDAVEYTYNVDGNIEYYVCEDCENCFKDSESKYKITMEETVILAPFHRVDFVVEVDENKEPVVLQLTDPQIIDVSKANVRCYNYITEVVNATNPDLIIITGDIIYGKFDHDGASLLSFINFMESFNIPWAPIFGNHDNESNMGADWQCEQFENAEHCLFKQRKLTGNGNYSVAIAQGEEIKRVFYMLDSNGCNEASEASLANGHTIKAYGFGIDQMQWYNDQINALKEIVPNVKISFAFHAQLSIFEDAFVKYGFDQSNSNPQINIDRLENNNDGKDLGYIGRPLKNAWDTDNTVFNGLVKLGVDSIFVGHEHCNSASIVFNYNGKEIRFQFGQKSSEYDRFNVLNSDGSIEATETMYNGSLMGGTVIALANDGTLKTPYIYYCGRANGKIDWSQWA